MNISICSIVYISVAVLSLYFANRIISTLLCFSGWFRAVGTSCSVWLVAGVKPKGGKNWKRFFPRRTVMGTEKSQQSKWSRFSKKTKCRVRNLLQSCILTVLYLVSLLSRALERRKKSELRSVKNWRSAPIVLPFQLHSRSSYAPAAFWVPLQLTNQSCALIALQFINQSYVQVALMLRIWNCAPTCAPICAPRSNLQTTLKVPVALLLRF